MCALDYIEETSPFEVRQLLLSAHHFLQDSLPPFATSSIKWRMLFYRLHRNFCYLNRHKDHITLGFPQGYKLLARPNILLGEADKLKQIRYLEIFSVEDLYSDITQEILHEAIIIDEMIGKNKPKRNFYRKRFQ
jgi:Domain of unknown function (DU1801)